MGLTNEHVGSKKPAKINAYILARAELPITLCYEIPCSTYYRVTELCNITYVTFEAFATSVSSSSICCF